MRPKRQTSPSSICHRVPAMGPANTSNTTLIIGQKTSTRGQPLSQVGQEGRAGSGRRSHGLRLRRHRRRRKIWPKRSNDHRASHPHFSDDHGWLAHDDGVHRAHGRGFSTTMSPQAARHLVVDEPVGLPIMTQPTPSARVRWPSGKHVDRWIVRPGASRWHVGLPGPGDDGAPCVVGSVMRAMEACCLSPTHANA